MGNGRELWIESNLAPASVSSMPRFGNRLNLGTSGAAGISVMFLYELGGNGKAAS